MRTYNRPIWTKSALKYKKVAILSFVLLYNISFGQIVKTFSKEIAVPEGVQLVSNSPSSMDLNIHGTITTNNTKDRYTINGKKNDVRLNILKDLEIETLDDNVVKQTTIVTIKTRDESEASKIMDQLQLNLKVGPDNRIVIDCNMNVNLFTMKNGWFKSDDCKIQLDNGQKYQIEYIAIETKLSVPKSCNLSIRSRQNCTIRLGEFDGNLNLDLKYAEVFGTTVNRLEASLESCYNVIFDKVNSANINSSNSYVEITKLDDITIGGQSLKTAPSMLNHSYQRSNSAQTKYRFGVIGQVNIKESANDEIYIKSVGEMKVHKSTFTNYQINRLNNSLHFDGKSSDIMIARIAPEFESINITNSLSTIDLLLDESLNYTLEIDKNSYIEGAEYILSMSNAKEKGQNIEKYTHGTPSKGGKIIINCNRCKLDIL